MSSRIPREAMPTRPSQLPGELSNVAEIIARELATIRPELADDAAMLATFAVFAVGEDYRGTHIYCPSMGKFMEEYRNNLIREEFDRRTNAGETATAVVKDLATREWPGERRRIGVRAIWDVLGKVDDRQLTLW